MALNHSTSFTDEMVSIGGVATHVYRAGEGEPLLWMHGSGGISTIQPFFEKLAQKHQVFLVDHPGFGRSERPEWLMDFTDYNYFYRDFLDYFALEKVNLIGHSLGGRIALEFAVSHTHRVNKLILLAAAGLNLEGMRRPDIFMLTPEERVRMVYYDSSLAERVLARPVDEDEQEVQAKNMVTLARLMWEKNFNPKFPRLLRYITVPTCILWGENDKMIPLPYGQALHEAIAGSQLHVLPECGHMPQVEQEEKCLSIINQFLATGESR